jgi:hypothetical protein
MTKVKVSGYYIELSHYYILIGVLELVCMLITILLVVNGYIIQLIIMLMLLEIGIILYERGYWEKFKEWRDN